MRKPNESLIAVDALAAWNDKSASAVAVDTLTLRCELITPMYGGGVTAGEVDAALPIRASALRGQLRFWWRLLHGRGRPPQETFAAETAIWGGIASTQPTASKVSVRVIAKPVAATQSVAKNSIPIFPSYALILDPGADPQLLQNGYRFQISLRFAVDLHDDQQTQVIDAVRWWASFGGVGARTRRGLGAVRVEGLTPVTSVEVATKGGCLVLLAPSKTPELAWKTSVDLLKDFRQKLEVGRNPPAQNSQSPAGRSRWPEADTIRDLSSHTHPNHAVPIVNIRAFPRSAFGLPIVFHFKGAPAKPHLRKNGMDPDDHTLEPADRSTTDKRNRMASPLILRPYWDGKAWRPAALLLPEWKQAISQPLKFKEQSYRPKTWPSDPAERQRLAAQIKPMQGRGNDPLSAFMDYFEKS